jgi:hypothetical protein
LASRIVNAISVQVEELRAHPKWRNFGGQLAQHPPMRGWLAVPMIGADGVTYEIFPMVAGASRGIGRLTTERQPAKC